MKHENKQQPQKQEVVKGVNPHSNYGASIGCPNDNKGYGDGIKIRGTGAATKGLRARGPMG